MSYKRWVVVSVHREKYTKADYEAGEAGERDTVVDCEAMDTEELRQCVRRYGISAPSGPSPANAWFISETPEEDREHFEQGVDKLYSMHVVSVDGHPPGEEDIQRVGDVIGVKFDRPTINGRLRKAAVGIMREYAALMRSIDDGIPEREALEQVRDAMAKDPACLDVIVNAWTGGGTSVLCGLHDETQDGPIYVQVTSECAVAYEALGHDAGTCYEAIADIEYADLGRQRGASSQLRAAHLAYMDFEANEVSFDPPDWAMLSDKPSAPGPEP